MTFRYTELSDEELGAYLAKIRRIARMDDTDALSEVDELINILGMRNVESGDDGFPELLLDDCEYEADELKDFEKEIKRARRWLERGEVWPWESLIQNAAELGEDWDSDEKRAELADEIKRLKTEAVELAGRIKACWAEQRVRESGKDIIHSISSIKKIHREMTEARDMLVSAGGLTPEMDGLIRGSLERCAWHRAKKKLSAAAIEKETGNDKKEKKLTAEARVLLKEDWKMIFDSDDCPDVGDVPD